MCSSLTGKCYPAQKVIIPEQCRQLVQSIEQARFGNPKTNQRPPKCPTFSTKNIPLRQRLPADHTEPHAAITRPIPRLHILPAHQPPQKPKSSQKKVLRKKSPAKRRRNATVGLNKNCLHVPITFHQRAPETLDPLAYLLLES